MKVLYITYDGLLDPIGASQILPYLFSLSNPTRSITIISFEKKHKFKSYGKPLMNKLTKTGINWVPLHFSSKFGLIGKAYDLIKMYVVCIALTIIKKFKLVHARGHVAAQIGMILKLTLRSKLIFDFRGLWVDERVNKGGWNLELVFDRFQYKVFKLIEKKIIRNSDHIVVLTEAVMQEINKIGDINYKNITVIPCCADFEHFNIQSKKIRKRTRSHLGIPDNTLVLGYLGSVGQMYKFDAYINLVMYAKLKKIQVLGLVVTQDKDQAIENIAKHPSIKHKDIFQVISATREQVPNYINTFDILVNFLTSSYARLATSPTRNAESFACGVPVICSAGIGDVDMHTKLLDSGQIVSNFDEDSLTNLVSSLNLIKSKGGENLRAKAKSFFDLEIAERRYKNVYSSIENIIK